MPDEIDEKPEDDKPAPKPPAGKVVEEGEETEKTANLQKQLTESQKRNRELEIKLAESEDQLGQLKRMQGPAKPVKEKFFPWD